MMQRIWQTERAPIANSGDIDDEIVVKRVGELYTVMQ
jgi:hypothetical protein